MKNTIMITVRFITILSSLLLVNVVNAETVWRALDNERTVIMMLPQGPVIIELAPQFSPNHVKHFSELVRANHYQQSKFYRVIDGFVAQAGPTPTGYKEKQINLEGDWQTDKTWRLTKVQQPDLFAEITGFNRGFAIGENPSEGKAWLTHCPGVIAMARGNDANSANSHFYITNGQAPRYLDRIMTIFGRVVYGMEHVQAITRTQVVEGDSPIKESEYTAISSMKLMVDLPKNEQWQLEIEDTESEAFATKLTSRIERNHAFFFKKPPQVLDICQVPVSTRIIKKGA